MPLIFSATDSHLHGKTGQTLMYVYICRAIRDRDIDAAVRAGARRPADVFRACGQSPQCGSCACDMRKQIEQTIAGEQAAPQSRMAAD
jgi:bacterioferritin-associated ferredoxin